METKRVLRFDTDRIQLVDATPACWSKSSCSLNASAGVFQPSVLRGLVFRGKLKKLWPLC